MANSKISALTSATTPLAGTETLPIVQSGVTVKSTVADITGSGLYPGSFTTLASTGNATLGDASTDTVRINGYLGVGNVGATTTAIRVRYVPTGGTIGYAVNASTTFAADVTNIAISGAFGVITTASAYTLGTVRTIDIADATKGAGSTITNQNGVYINDLTSGTNNYGITSLVASGTNKWNIYASGTAQNYFAGTVGVGTTGPSASAILDAQSTTKGVRMPNMTTVQKNAIASPAAGLMVFDTTLAKLCVYSGAAWQTITSI